MKYLALAVILLVSTASSSAVDNFGDQVARCMVEKGYRSDSSSTALEIFTAICEREVTVTNTIVGYLLCTRTMTPVVDDQISDVGNIAAGLHAACHESLSRLDSVMSTEEVEQLVTKTRPKVIQQVLENRAKGRLVPTPQPATRRQIKPTT